MVDEAVSPALLERARTPGLAPLWEELSRRLGASDRPVRRVRLRGLDPAGREALADLLGWPRLPDADVQVPVAGVCEALRVDEAGLRALVAALCGPVGNRAAQRARDAEQRTRLWEEVAEAVAGRGLGGWVARLRAAGVPDGDVDAHRARLGPVLAAVADWPLDPAQPLARVAQRHAGDPHAFDYGTWAGGLLADAAAAVAGLDAPASAEAARHALVRVGVVSDRLSAPVLTLGLRPDGADPLADALAGLADAGEPTALTASQLRRWPLRVDDPDVWVVENPSVVAVAADAGIAAPLVCTASWPTEAGVVLLDQLRESGARLHYHSDFDATGLALTGHLLRRFEARQWRMGAADYLAALADARAELDPSGLPATPWDERLRDAMLTHRRIVYQEQVVHVLLADLA